MEHSPVSLEGLRAIVLATSGLDAAVFARVPVVAFWTAKRVLDLGVNGVIFPFVSDAELASTAALSCRYPPAGLAQSTWPDPGNYYDSADADILTVCVIEEEQALADLDTIVATPGIDIIFVGTSDLFFSMGFRGRQDESKLQEAIQTIAEAAKPHHKFLGRPAASAVEINDYRKERRNGYEEVERQLDFVQGWRRLCVRPE